MNMADVCGSGISILVAFRGDGNERTRNWAWLKKYWETSLTDAELIVADTDSTVFNKSAALNKAFRKSSGDVILTMDADMWVPAFEIVAAADDIRHGNANWVLPYRVTYHMDKIASAKILDSQPHDPARYHVDNDHVIHRYLYASGLTVTPRDAWEAVDMMDERFCGWGGEDISFQCALDTLWGYHTRYTMYDAIHLWHPILSFEEHKDNEYPFPSIIWKNQKRARHTTWLQERYEKALGKPEQMRDVVGLPRVHGG
jgi:glycosyltransferase involved in cell wall biosynthesis